MEKWPSWDEAIKRVHNPKHTDDLNPNSRARQRLAYDQILANQLAIALVRKQLVKRKGKAIVDKKSLYEKIHKTGLGLSASIFGKNKKRMNKIIKKAPN